VQAQLIVQMVESKGQVVEGKDPYPAAPVVRGGRPMMRHPMMPGNRGHVVPSPVVHSGGGGGGGGDGMFGGEDKTDDDSDGAGSRDDSQEDDHPMDSSGRGYGLGFLADSMPIPAASGRLLPAASEAAEAASGVGAELDAIGDEDLMDLGSAAAATAHAHPQRARRGLRRLTSCSEQVGAVECGESDRTLGPATGTARAAACRASNSQGS
jgi:hypothetical protein